MCVGVCIICVCVCPYAGGGTGADEEPDISFFGSSLVSLFFPSPIFHFTKNAHLSLSFHTQNHHNHTLHSRVCTTLFVFYYISTIMRTSRGLRITSLIVAFPVLLILSSLVLICALAIQTQVKAWAAQHQPQFLDVAQRPISRLATSTALALSPKPFTRRFRLKHFLPSTVWSWLGVLTVFALITVQKVKRVGGEEEITYCVAVMTNLDHLLLVGYCFLQPKGLRFYYTTIITHNGTCIHNLNDIGR